MELFKLYYPEVYFAKPRTDPCETCAIALFFEDTDSEEFKAHVKRWHESREEMQHDKEIAAHDPTVAVISWDKQMNLATPHSNVGSAFYKRKLKTNY